MDEQRELALAEMRSHREFSHPNLMPLKDWAFVRVPQGEAAFLLFPFMDREFHSIRVVPGSCILFCCLSWIVSVALLLGVVGSCLLYLLLSLCVHGS